MLHPSLTKWLVNYARSKDVTEGYADDWTVAQIRDPAQRIVDRIDVLMRGAKTGSPFQHWDHLRQFGKSKMSRAKLSQYSGKLDAKQIALGMNAARRNARRLADDAKSLFDITRYQTAAAIAILSIEESGKVSILRGLALAPDSASRRKLWKDYRSHRRKNGAWIIPELFLKGARTLESLQCVVDPSAEHTALLDQVKQIALYTDCLGAAHWSEPLNVIDKNLSGSLVNTADLLAKGTTVTEREIELWIEYMAPTYGASLAYQKHSLSKWYAAMRENDLWEDGTISLDTFLWGNEKKTGFRNVVTDNDPHP